MGWCTLVIRTDKKKPGKITGSLAQNFPLLWNQVYYWHTEDIKVVAVTQLWCQSHLKK